MDFVIILNFSQLNCSNSDKELIQTNIRNLYYGRECELNYAIKGVQTIISILSPINIFETKEFDGNLLAYARLLNICYELIQNLPLNVRSSSIKKYIQLVKLQRIYPKTDSDKKIKNYFVYVAMYREFLNLIN